MQSAIAALGGGTIEGWSCWDLGAHFGIYSVALARRAGPLGQVAAFEPNPLSFARLERHRRMNHLDWLKCYQAAASDKTGRSELVTSGDLGSTSTHLLYKGESLGESSRPIQIRTLRLDEEVTAGRLRAPRFVKVDVEGHAGAALEGMKETLAAALPEMIIAFHSEDEVERCLAVVGPLGYSWTVIVPPPANERSMIGGDYLFVPLAARK